MPYLTTGSKINALIQRYQALDVFRPLEKHEMESLVFVPPPLLVPDTVSYYFVQFGQISKADCRCFTFRTGRLTIRPKQSTSFGAKKRILKVQRLN